MYNNRSRGLQHTLCNSMYIFTPLLTAHMYTCIHKYMYRVYTSKHISLLQRNLYRVNSNLGTIRKTEEVYKFMKRNSYQTLPVIPRGWLDRSTSLGLIFELIFRAD